MIQTVFANDPRFRKIVLKPGMNIILAERTRESTKKDSRNGLGKSTLLEIIHFLLGSTGEALTIPDLKGWVFSMEMVVGGQQILVRRSVDHPKTIEIEGNLDSWPIPGMKSLFQHTLQSDEWAINLGWFMFGLYNEPNARFQPSFRSLISYFIRRPDGYETPFEHYRKQREWQTQLDNMFLLGLDWSIARHFQELREKETLLRNLRQAPQAGLMEHLVGDLGELEAEHVRLRDTAQATDSQLKSFQVHPQYREIEQKANKLTESIHEASNRNLVDRQTIKLYQNSLIDESEPAPFDVTAIYKAAQVALPGSVVRHLKEVEDFHRQVVQNRRTFLHSEIERLNSTIRDREEAIKKQSNERAEFLRTLRTHKALDEYTSLQKHHTETLARLKELEARITNLRAVQASKSQIRMDRERLFLRTLADETERRMAKDRAQSLFRENTEALYGSPPGLLIIEATKSGYKFNTEIRREGSSGVKHMKVLCYDLTLAQLWAQRERSPNMLLHDSTIFDGVDERQRAQALERAAWSAERFGHQYICTFNSDMLPITDFSPGFSIEQFVRHRLTDEHPEGCLLGFRFERWKQKKQLKTDFA